MKNADSRQAAEEYIRWAIGINDTRVKASVKKLSKDYGFEPTKIERLWRKGFKDIDLYDDVELCALYICISSSYQDEMPDPSELFTDIEISDTKRLKFKTPQALQKSDELIIKNAFLLKNNEWCAVMSMRDIVDIDNSGRIRYNPATQRPMEQSNKSFMKRISVNRGQVDEIAEKISIDEYHPDAITLNVLNDNKSSLIYNEEENSLYIKGIIDIPDGYHRLEAMHKAIKSNPYREMNFVVIITYLDEDGAQDLLAQRNKGTRIDLRYTSAMETTKQSNVIVNNIIHHKNASLIYKKKIVKSQQEIMAGGLMRFSELSEAIEKEYGITRSSTPATINDTVNWLVEFFNEMTNHFSQEWEDKKSTRTWKAAPFAFPAYISLSKKLQNMDNWKELLGIILNKIDFTDKNIKASRSIPKTKRVIEEIANIVCGGGG